MSEFSVSAKFPHLATGVPLTYQQNVIVLVLNVLQPMCDSVGWTCVITSGYRGRALNEVVGGKPTSQHTIGEAADCVFKRGGKAVPIIEVLRLATALNFPFDQMIAYPNFVHFSHTKRRENRRQVLYNKSYNGDRL